MKCIASVFANILLLSSIVAQEHNNYTQFVEAWHKARIQDLKKPNSWLNLEGLYWLHAGVNSFGSDKGADLVYDHPKFPKHVGDFILNGDSVLWSNTIENGALVNQVLSPLNTKSLVFNASSTAILQYNQFTWNVIKREDKIGVRFRNLQAKTLTEFKGIDRFPVQQKWQLKARLIQPQNGLLMIANVLGQITAQKNAGKLLFEIAGKQYSLDVIDEGGPKYFITFSDATSNISTYGTGRFIEVNKPDQNGNTIIDFNLAYNPPCAFTPFATCPLPPPQNRLTIAITAGEKKYGHH